MSFQREKNKECLEVMIKPSSSLCNFKCKYCFYEAESNERNVFSYGFMNLETAKKIISCSFSYCKGNIYFIFQGGEPCLIGLDFYKFFVSEVNKQRTTQTIFYSIQTNGSLLDDDFCKFFKENDFLVGISLDGIRDIHNYYRKTKPFDKSQGSEENDDSYLLVLRGINLIKKYGIPFNILSVVTDKSLECVEDTYNFFKGLMPNAIQFIPCLPDIYGISYLSAKKYGNFLKRLYDLYEKDLLKGEYIPIRYFDNIERILKGQCVEACNLLGHCTLGLVIESNGDIFPCDFYVADDKRLGSVYFDNFSEILNSSVAADFEKQYEIKDECKACKFFMLCKGGCRREKSNEDEKDYFCEGLIDFFEYAIIRYYEILLNL